MRAVIQRVSTASLTIDNQIYSKIELGMVVLLGIEHKDTQEDVEWITSKISQLRIFADENGLMNQSLHDVGGDILLVSQFTLHASTKKGNRPSFIQAAKPDHAIPLYELAISQLNLKLQKTIKTGVFGANMKITLVNDGPVTIIIDSKEKW
jgi:D-tyrosyl-tRNA(Tyr) deacylase